MVVRSPTPFGLGRNGCWPSRGSQLPQALPFIFSLCCPLNDRRRAAHSFFKIGRLFSLFLLSYSSLALFCLLILLLLLMSGNVHPNPGPMFPCSVCAGNVTWRGQSVQCCTCTIWVHLRCSQLFLSKFRALGRSHSWSFPLPYHCDSLLGLLRHVYLHCTIWPPSANAALLPPSSPNLLSPSAHFISSPAPSPPSLAPDCLSAPPASSPPDSLRALQWNAGGLRARSTELLHFFSTHSVDLICIQESNLNSSSSFRISGFSALHSDRIHSRSGILSPDAMHASGGVVIFVRQGLSFSELSTSSLSSLDPYSDYVGVNISLNNSSLLSFLNVYAPPIHSFPADGRIDSFSPSILSSSRNLFILGDFNCHQPLWDSKGTSDPRGKKVFDWVISSDLLPLNDPDTPTLLHCSSGSRSSPDICFAPSLALPCSWEVLQDLGSDHLPILLSVLLSPVYFPNKRPPSFNLQKACEDGFASYFDFHCPSAEEYSSHSLSSAAALFSSLALNAAKSSIPFDRIKRPPKAWWSAEVESAVSERRKAFAAAHRSDEDRQAYISASRRASTVIAKAKVEAWQTTCSSLSPKSNPKSVHSLLCSIAGFFSSSSSSPNFPNCSSSKVWSMPLTCGPTFPFLSQVSCVAEPEAISLSSAEPRALRSLTRPFALPSLPLNFLRLSPTFPCPLPLAQTKLPIPY